MNSDELKNLIGRVSYLHFIQGLTQSVIAQKLDLSRGVVQRLLKTAVEKGLVEIKINDPQLRCYEAEFELAERFGLDGAVVADNKGIESVKSSLARSAALWLGRHLSHEQTIAVGMGTTLRAITSFMRKKALKGVRIIPLMGTFSKKGGDSPFELASNLADILGAECYAIPAPAVADSTETKKMLLSESGIKEVLSLARKADLALVGLGAASDGGSLLTAGYISRAEAASMASKGAVGELLGHFYDHKGKPVKSRSSPRIIGFDLDEIRGLKNVAAVAGGPEKYQAVEGALAGGLIKTLITDLKTARRLLDGLKAA
ncbi:MAG: sugar-binding transcriptional regulator [Deltaproteobacteria bacterium]|jgi:DNA-binding transcriptional regulator LsrR (DeoR family)|nr:sugar-binding transcriptional regulator [Deltaproteobacteria bacterium]